MLFEGVQKLQSHFQLLLQRLKFLEEACGTDCCSTQEARISFGVVKINCYGDARVDKTVWNRIATAVHDLTQLSG